ncbi:MAG: T9SS type A sorting domain-containing protein, partial [Saprospiraceae bacterium]
WTESGIYPLLFSNVHGCDSIINFHVTIHHSSETQFDVTTCDAYSTPDGQHTWTETGMYAILFMSIHGCDSTINYNVTILESSQTEIEATTCNAYSTSDGLHTWTTSGIYPIIYTNIAGCDSVVTYDLTIHYDRDTVVSIMACDRYTTPDGLHTWVNSGVYEYSIPTQTGCDSTITLDLNIVNLDNSVTATGTSLISNQAGASYQWIDCNLGGQIIEGEIGQTFSPTVSGNYGVIISMNECSDTSACIPVTITGVYNADNDWKIKIYPNPVEDIIHIDLGSFHPQAKVVITTVDGKILTTSIFQDQRYLQMEPDLGPGLYLIAIESNGLKVVKKLIVL